MTNLTAAAKAGMLMAVGTGAVQAIEDHSISMKTVASVGLIVFAGVWRLSKILEADKQEAKALREHVAQFEKTTTDTLKRIENKVEVLPCMKPVCPSDNHNIKPKYP